MDDRGIQISFTPVRGERGTFLLNVYTEEYENGSLVGIFGMLGGMIEFDPTWTDSVPDTQLAALAAEAASQLLSADQDPDTARSFRESVARELKSVARLLPGE